MYSVSELSGNSHIKAIDNPELDPSPVILKYNEGLKIFPNLFVF